jgi:hypothetical protein
VLSLIYMFGWQRREVADYEDSRTVRRPPPGTTY